MNFLEHILRVFAHNCTRIKTQVGSLLIFILAEAVCILVHVGRYTIALFTGNSHTSCH